jgi:hypothetical protein
VIGFLEFLALVMCIVALVLSEERSFGISVFMTATAIVLTYLAVVEADVFWIPSVILAFIGYVKFSQSVQDARENKKFRS